MSRNSPETCSVTSTRGKSSRACGRISKPMTRALAVIPARRDAHQRQRLREILAAGADRRAAPEVEHDVARTFAMRLRMARHHLARRAARRCHRPSASAHGADRCSKRLRPVGSTSARPRDGAPAGPGSMKRPASAAISALALGAARRRRAQDRLSGARRRHAARRRCAFPSGRTSRRRAASASRRCPSRA